LLAGDGRSSIGIGGTERQTGHAQCEPRHASIRRYDAHHLTRITLPL
jgi:hypothetical protein